MTSIVINISSGYVNAGLFLVFEVFLINILLASGRKRLESYHTCAALMKGKKVPLKQLNILGVETRLDRFSIIIVVLMWTAIVGLGVMEWGINGETGTKTVMREGFVYGGETAIGSFKTTRSLLEEQREEENPKIKFRQLGTYGFMSGRPSGILLHIREKCTKIEVFDRVIRGSERVSYVFSIQRAAVEKTEIVVKYGDSISVNMTNARFSCLEDTVTAVSGSCECCFLPENVHLYKSIDPKLWRDQKSVYMWNRNFEFATRKSDIILSCAKKQGYRERFLVRVQTGFDPEEYLIWDIHKMEENMRFKYMLIHTSLKRNNRGVFEPIFRGSAEDHSLEVTSTIPLSHSVVLAAVVSASGASDTFLSDLADIFFDHLGNSYLNTLEYRMQPVIPEEILGENGTQQGVQFVTLPFKHSTQATRIELWSLISLMVLVLTLLAIRIKSESLWRSLPVRANVMSSEWLGNEIIKSSAIRDDYVLENPSACIELVDGSDLNEMLIRVVNEKKSSKTIRSLKPKSNLRHE